MKKNDEIKACGSELKNINILALDGGGIRGVITAKVLERVERELQIHYNDDNFKLTNHFDYISGTSTGGILTCLYTIKDKEGKQKYSAEEVFELYYNLGDDIFKKRIRYFLTFFGAFGSRYSTKTMERLFKKYFTNRRIKDSVVPIMLPSVDTVTRDLFLFKSYSYLSNKYKFSDAALATSAASTYFNAKKLDNKSLVDGGFGMNNPAAISFAECKNLFNIDTTKGDRINILSIGTGAEEKSYKYSKVKNWGIINGISKIFNITLTSTSDAVHLFLSETYKDDIGRYLRVHPKLYGASNKIDKGNRKNMNRLKEAGEKSFLDFKESIIEFIEGTCK